MLVHGLLTRWRWAPLIIFAATAAFAIFTYALTYTVLRYHTDPARAAEEPLMLAVYVLHIIGGIAPLQPGQPAAAIGCRTGRYPFHCVDAAFLLRTAHAAGDPF